MSVEKKGETDTPRYNSRRTLGTIIAVIGVITIVAAFGLMTTVNFAGRQDKGFSFDEESEKDYIESIIEEEEIFDEDLPAALTGAQSQWAKYGLTLEEGIVSLGDGDYDLQGAVFRFGEPIQIIGPGTLRNATFIIEDLTDVTIQDVDTVGLTVSISDASGITITGSSFSGIEDDILGFIVVRDTVTDLLIENNHFEDIQYLTSSSTYGCGIKITVNGGTLENVVVRGNTFTDIHGPAAIWVGGNGTRIVGMLIEDNFIQHTENFGIEFYQYNGELFFEETYVQNNTVYDIGSLREREDGAGAGGIYSNLTSGDIYALDNDVRRVLEVGIEGYFTNISGNYIEDTGMNQLDHPIKDSAGIYMSGPEVTDNIIVNPGSYGGIHKFTSGIFEDRVISGNTIMNIYEPWNEESEYTIGDMVVSNNKWYVAIEAGTSGSYPPDGSREGVNDGTVVWNYKKPLADAAIRINAVRGIADFTVSGNTTVDLEYFNALSGFIDNVTIEDNQYYYENLRKGQLKFLTGYGNRKTTVGLVTEADRQSYEDLEEVPVLPEEKDFEEFYNAE